MNVIHKAVLTSAITGIPNDATVLSVGAQRGNVCVWYTTDPDNLQMPAKHLLIVGTGHTAPDAATHKYLGTAVVEPYVWHVFEMLAAVHP